MPIPVDRTVATDAAAGRPDPSTRPGGEADLLRVFDPFFTTRPVGRGAGLGRSIGYGLVTAGRPATERTRKRAVRLPPAGNA